MAGGGGGGGDGKRKVGLVLHLLRNPNLPQSFIVCSRTKKRSLYSKNLLSIPNNFLLRNQFNPKQII
jgi:hypothetical protein